MKAFFIALTAMFCCVTGTAQDPLIDQTWSGEIRSAMGAIDINLKFKQKRGKLLGQLSSEVSGASRLKLDSVNFDGNELYFELRSFQASFRGTLKDSSIIGNWGQGTLSVPITFVPRANYEPTVTILKRAQTPEPPFDYISKEIVFGDEVELEGTITVPHGPGPHPAVVLLSVAGPNDRDESHSRGHKPFMVLADHLTRNGIAVLRFDDRGVGFSGGDLYASSFEDLVTDALSAIDFLRSMDIIDPGNIGIIGHSEGTVIGPMTAIREPGNVSFLVLLGPAGVPLIELTESRLEVAWVDRGLSEAQNEELLTHMKGVTAILHENLGDKESYEKIAALQAELTLDNPKFPTQQFMIPKEKDERIKLFISPWYRSQATYHPRDYFPRLDVPVLSITGTLDKLQTPELNVPPIRRYLTEAPVTDFTVLEFPDVNHLMQTAKTGLPTEYPLLDETFSPEVLKIISAWILKRV